MLRCAPAPPGSPGHARGQIAATARIPSLSRSCRARPFPTRMAGDSIRLGSNMILKSRTRRSNGFHGSRPALRLRRARAAHRRGDDARPPRQAPPGLRRQSERSARGDRVGRPRRRGRAAQPLEPAGRQAGPGAQQRRRPLQPLALLADAQPRRRRRAERRAGQRDRRDLRLLRLVQGRVQKSRPHPLRLRLGLAGQGQLRPRRRLDAEPGLAGARRQPCRCSAATSGSTPTTSSTRTSAPHYIDAFWNVVNWDYVGERFSQ